MAHDEVSDDIAEKVKQRALEGMGFNALHSAHYAKPFKALMGTTSSLKWLEACFESNEQRKPITI